MDGAQKIGLPFIEDMNSSSSPILGVGKCQFTIDGDAHRNSSYSAFLPQKLALARRSHLSICTETVVTRLDVKIADDGIPQVDGVYLRSSTKNSSNAYVSARREIILCSGPLSNPQILQLRFAYLYNPSEPGLTSNHIVELGPAISLSHWVSPSQKIFPASALISCAVPHACIFILLIAAIIARSSRRTCHVSCADGRFSFSLGDKHHCFFKGVLQISHSRERPTSISGSRILYFRKVGFDQRERRVGCLKAPTRGS